MLTVDIDNVKVEYPSMWELLGDLQDMGEGNVVIGRFFKMSFSMNYMVNKLCARRNTIHRDTLTAASAIYKGWFSPLHTLVFSNVLRQSYMDQKVALYLRHLK